MKTSFFLRIGIALLILLAARSSFAQKVTRNDTLPTLIISPKSVVSQKVKDAFRRDFQGALNPRWYQVNQNYLVKFVRQDQKNNALYNKHGYIVYHIAYVNKNNLPQQIRDQIKEKYSNCKIITAMQVNQENRSMWMVNLKLRKQLILVREEDGELSEMERHKNASI
jgi:hypothetical protein